MADRRARETGKDRKAFARDAGLGQVSFLSILAGTLIALASFAIVLAIVAAILTAVGLDVANLTSNDYERLGIGSAIVAGLVLFISYFFGGYIAGRLARRSGALNGGLVFVLAILIGAAVALVVGTQADTEAVAAELRVLGVPTSGSDYGSIATIGGIVSLALMLLGAILGGVVGERWHAKLANRASSPDVGPAAAVRHEQAEADQRRHDLEQERRDQERLETQRLETQERRDQERLEQGRLETRAWGSPAPEAGHGDGDGNGEPAGNGGSRSPRRERPLRSGRRA